MNPIKSFLLAVDFTDHSKITLQNAINFCKEIKSSLSLIHVITDLKQNREIVCKNAQDKIDEIVKLLNKENIEVPHVEVKYGLGYVEDHVVSFAKSIKVDAIIIGSGNYHHNKKHRLGGVAEAILRESTLPVLIIKNSFVPIKGQIACPIDFSPASEFVIKSAIDYAKYVGGDLVMIHAVEPAVYGYTNTEFDYLYADQNFFSEKSNLMDSFLNQFDFKGVKWTKKILLGSPTKEIPEYIKKYPFVMTIMSSASRIGISRLILGSVAESVTRNIDSPCLVIKKTT